MSTTMRAVRAMSRRTTRVRSRQTGARSLVVARRESAVWCASHRHAVAAAPRMHVCIAQLAGDPAGDEVDDRRDDEHRAAEEPHLELVVDADAEEGPIGGTGGEDGDDPGEERRADRGAAWVVARAVEQVVTLEIARE